MSDQDFNFNPPPRREVKKAFEPPPWEREQFEELARRRAAAEAADAPAETPSTEQPPGPVREQNYHEPTEATTPEEHDEEESPDAQEKAEEAKEDPRVEAMLAGLRREEPEFGANIWKATVAAGAVLASVGAVLVIWGVFAVFATRRTGVVGSLGGGVLIIFGLIFFGVGVWMAFRALRQQGVL